MKKTAFFFIFALLFTLTSCDTTETRTIRIATGSSNRAEAADFGVSYVVIAAYQGTIDQGNLAGMTTAPAGSVASLVVPANTDLEIFVACADSEMVMMPYFGIGYYQPEIQEDNLVTVSMEKKIFEYPSVSIPESSPGAEYISDSLPHFRVNWTIFYDADYFLDGFDGETDKYLQTGLFRMLIYQSISSPDDMQYVGFTYPSEESYDDYTPFQYGMDYYYSISLSIPSMGLEGPASGEEFVYAEAIE